MARRKTAPGDTTEVAYHMRTDQGSWTAADPMDIAVARAKRGRQWRARTRMGLSDGNTMTVSRSGATPSIALGALERVVAQERRRILEPETSVPTFGDLVRWAVDRIEAGRDPNVKSTNSQRTYGGVASRWAGYPAPEASETEPGPRAHIKRSTPHESAIYAIRIDRLAPADLADEVERIVAAGGSGSLPQLRALWRKATARGIALRFITTDPAAGIHLPSQNEARGKRVYNNGSARPRDNSLTGEQLVTLRAEVKARYPRQRLDVSDLIILGSYTGLRIAEANSLRWTDVHFGDSESFLTIEGQVFGAGADRKWEPRVKTDSSRRTVPLPPPAADILRERKETARAARAESALVGVGAKFVFPAQMGGVPDLATTMKAVRRTLDRAGFPWVTFHTLRRTVERQLMDADADPRVIMAVMGHDPATSWSAYVDRNVDVSGVADLLR